MNTFDEIIKLNNKLLPLLSKNHGKLQLTFFDGTSITANILSINSDYNIHERTYVSKIKTFDNDIDKTTIYDLAYVRNIS